MTGTVTRNWRSLGIAMLLSLLGAGAALYALRATAQAADPPAAPPAAPSVPSAPEESATIEDDPTIAADPAQSADNNVSFPVDI